MFSYDSIAARDLCVTSLSLSIVSGIQKQHQNPTAQRTPADIQATIPVSEVVEVVILAPQLVHTMVTGSLPNTEGDPYTMLVDTGTGYAWPGTWCPCPATL